MNSNKKNDMTYIDIKQIIDVMSIVCNKLDDQAIQLSTIAAQMIEQNKKLNALTPQSEYIGTKELARRFDTLEGSQKSCRGRIKNPLPFYQDVENGKISYKVSEVEEWKSQQKLNHYGLKVHRFLFGLKVRANALLYLSLGLFQNHRIRILV